MEIGSEFHIRLDQLKEVHDTVYQYLSEYNTIYTDSGRSAIRVVCSQIKARKVLLPEYICDSVIESFRGFEIEFYSLDSDLQIDMGKLEGLLAPDKVLFLMHYFGIGAGIQSGRILEKIQQLKNRLEFCVIEDTTHSIFSEKQTVGDYCICSIRKWFPIPDGGICYSRHPLNYQFFMDLPSKSAITKLYSMIAKDLYLRGLDQDIREYRALAVQAESHMGEDGNIRPISRVSQTLLSCCSVTKMQKQRKKNYNQLLDYLKQLGIHILENGLQTGCPFVLPVITEGRNQLRGHLIEKKIYCAVHWPVEIGNGGITEHAVEISNRILSLPIDQRYNQRHMKYISDKIKDYLENHNKNHGEDGKAGL